jgi:carbonic anhydrase
VSNSYQYRSVFLDSILYSLTFEFSPEQAVRDDMKFLAESPYLASKDTPIKLHGFIYDIKTGELEKVQD